MFPDVLQVSFGMTEEKFFRRRRYNSGGVNTWGAWYVINLTHT